MRESRHIRKGFRAQLSELSRTKDYGHAICGYLGLARELILAVFTARSLVPMVTHSSIMRVNSASTHSHKIALDLLKSQQG